MKIHEFLKFVNRKMHLRKPYAFITHLFTPYGYINNDIVFPMQAFFRTHGFADENDKKLAALRDKHKGERIFIIATGPSLTVEDVNKLKNEHTIGVNSIFRIYKKTGWLPEYYMSLDKMFFDKLGDDGYLDMENFARDHCFVNALCKKYGQSSKTIFLHTCWLDHVWNYGSKRFKYNPNLVYGLYDFYSVSHSAILMAIYMGFKDIYFIGVDNNYMGSKTHFDATTADDEFDYESALRTQQSMDAGYDELFRISKRMGVNIYNATRGGNVKPFPRVKLEDIEGLK